MRVLSVTAICLLAGLAWGSAAADQRDQRLEVLFGELKGELALPEAQQIEREIWRIWYEHEDSAVVQLMRQGQSAMARRDFLAAQRAFDQVVRIVPDFAEGWNARATLFYLMGRYPASLADIEATLKLEPRHFGALAGRGLVYSALEEWERALDSFEAALAVNPHMPGTQRNAEMIRRDLEQRDI